jgi:phosphonate transport system permease protein
VRRDLLVMGGIGVALGVVLGQMGFFEGERMGRGLVNAGRFARDLFPPDASVTPTAVKAMLETVQMAFAGTLLGFLLSLPLGVLGVRFLFPRPVTYPARLLSAWVRTVPALLWAILFVIVVGLGPLAGTLGIALYTVGYLSKLYADLFEGTDPEVVEAVRGVGASRLHLVRFVVFPEGANGVLAQLLFMLEYNIRASAILGFVGAGGIGFLLQAYIQTLEYQRLATVLLLLLGVVLGMEALGGWVRRRFLLTPS